VKPLAIFGAGGMAKEAFFFAKDLHLKVGAFFDYRAREPLYGVDVLDEEDFNPEEFLAVIAIGKPTIRSRIASRLSERHATFMTLIHPSVVIYGRDTVTIGDGGFLCPGCLLTCDISLGKFCQLNLGTTICHGTQAGDYFTTAPGVNISGNVKIGNNVHLGTNCSVIHEVTITDNVTIGAGACVVDDILESGTYAGTPARYIHEWTPSAD